MCTLGLSIMCQSLLLCRTVGLLDCLKDCRTVGLSDMRQTVADSGGAYDHWVYCRNGCRTTVGTQIEGELYASEALPHPVVTRHTPC